jgi:hypothetical protein
MNLSHICSYCDEETSKHTSPDVKVSEEIKIFEDVSDRKEEIPIETLSQTSLNDYVSANAVNSEDNPQTNNGGAQQYVVVIPEEPAETITMSTIKLGDSDNVVGSAVESTFVRESEPLDSLSTSNGASIIVETNVGIEERLSAPFLE